VRLPSPLLLADLATCGGLDPPHAARPIAAVATSTASLPGRRYVLGLLRQRSCLAALRLAAIRVSSRPQTKHEELGTSVPVGLDTQRPAAWIEPRVAGSAARLLSRWLGSPAL